MTVMTFLAGRQKDTERDVRTAAGPIHFVTGCLDVLATKDLCIPMVNVEWCNLVIARGRGNLFREDRVRVDSRRDVPGARARADSRHGGACSNGMACTGLG